MRRIKREEVARAARQAGVNVAVAAAVLNGAAVRCLDSKPALTMALMQRFNPKEKS